MKKLTDFTSEKIARYVAFYTKYLDDLNDKEAKDKLIEIIEENQYPDEDKKIANHLIKML